MTIQNPYPVIITPKVTGEKNLDKEKLREVISNNKKLGILSAELKEKYQTGSWIYTKKCRLWRPNQWKKFIIISYSFLLIPKDDYLKL
jgi:hypothetical protein